MDVDHPQLVLDEQMFLLALRYLADLEGEEQPFALLEAVHGFTNENYLAARFSLAVDRDIEADDKRAIEYYVGAIYLVYHHRANIEDLDEVFADLIAPVARFVRAAGWAFLSAWNFRYGGVLADRVTNHTLVDPRLDN